MQTASVMTTVDKPRFTHAMSEFPSGVQHVEGTNARHVLAQGQEVIAMAFASKDKERLTDMPWRDTMREVPHIEGCAVVLDCTVANVLPGVDHRVVTALFAEADVAGERAPLLYHRRRMAAMPKTLRRHSMIRTFVMYGAPEDPEAFDTYYRDVHIPLVRKMPHLISCEVSQGGAEIVPDGGSYHLVAILNYESKVDMEAALASEEGKVAVADVANFATGGVTLVTAEYDTV